MFERDIVVEIADELGTDPGLIEKDWYVVQALKVLSDLDLGEVRLIFSGGTCLSKAYGLIQRFSEDVDFKADVPPGYGRPQRRELRKTIEAALIEARFSLADDAIVRDEGRFFALKLDYAGAFSVPSNMRAHIQVEVSLRKPKFAPQHHAVQSFVARALRQKAEVPSIGCADPVETAAEKLSALAWRVLSRRANPANHDASMIRHLHDLAVLESRLVYTEAFVALAREVVALDAVRGDQNRPKEFDALLKAAVYDLRNYKPWETDYRRFIQQVSYGTEESRLSFRNALASLERLVSNLCS